MLTKLSIISRMDDSTGNNDLSSASKKSWMNYEIRGLKASEKLRRNKDRITFHRSIFYP